jgi:hypothetical protein
MLRASLNVYEHFTPDSERLYHGDRRIAVLVIDHALLCVPNQPSRLSRSPNIITHARGGRTTAGSGPLEARVSGRRRTDSGDFDG